METQILQISSIWQLMDSYGKKYVEKAKVTTECSEQSSDVGVFHSFITLLYTIVTTMHIQKENKLLSLPLALFTQMILTNLGDWHKLWLTNCWTYKPSPAISKWHFLRSHFVCRCRRASQDGCHIASQAAHELPLNTLKKR